MELMDVILRRRSIRKYTDQDIPEETLDKILQAGLLAPTSRNLKPCRFYVVKNKDVLLELSKAKAAGAGMLAGCNAAVAVFADAGKADTWVEDCSIAMSYMMLMAESLGIGSCWVQFHLRTGADGSDAEANVREILSVPEGYRMAGILSLGLPAEQLKSRSPDDADREKLTYVV